MSMLSSAGGAGVIRTAVDLFSDRLLADPGLAHYWTRIDMDRLRSHQRAFLLAALGGPNLYSGREMHDAHSGLDITDADFDRVVGHLADSLREAGVSEDSVGEIARLIAPLRRQIVAS